MHNFHYISTVQISKGRSMNSNKKKTTLVDLIKTPLENRLLCILVRNTTLKENNVQAYEKTTLLLSSMN